MIASALIAVNVALGIAAWVDEHRIADHAVGIYDAALDAAAHLEAAELSFERSVSVRAGAASAAERTAADDLLRRSSDELAAAIDRAPTASDRALREAVRAYAVALRANDPSANARLADAEAGFARLEALAPDRGRKAREEMRVFSVKGDRLLIALAATRAVAAAISLTILLRMITRMAFLADHDPLTRLLKRPALHVRLAEALAKLRGDGCGFALLTLDLDRFKRVNDTLGHHTGDLLLIEVAQRISEFVRGGDTVARFGGDEFVILQSGVRTPDDARALAARLVQALGAPYEIGGQQILIGASVGIALAPENGREAGELLRNSDIALYQAKAGGKGRFLFFAAEMNTIMQSKRVMEIDLREALEKRELEVHFQPIVDLSTGRIVACEALARWRHRTRGPVSPSEFVPLAEETGLIAGLGIFVLREACTQAASWPDEIRVAVNLSALQFGSDDLVSVVSGVLAETGLPANRLDLEITETLLMQDRDEVVSTLTTLRDRGARISLDDFGAGYSSLAYLSSFPFDKIKIDRAFVRNVANRSESAAIIRAIISLASALGMTTTAEGVETAEDFDWVRSHGCQEGQGFLFSRPVCSRELAPLLGTPIAPRRDFAPAEQDAA